MRGCGRKNSSRPALLGCRWRRHTWDFGSLLSDCKQIRGLGAARAELRRFRKHGDSVESAELRSGCWHQPARNFFFVFFAIPFLQKLTKSNVVAVVLPAFSWGFLHTAYPNEPPYIRGLEVGLIGVVAGIVMLRWGILATLVWHYTVDASLVGLLLIRSTACISAFRDCGWAGGADSLWRCGLLAREAARLKKMRNLLNGTAQPEMSRSHRKLCWRSNSGGTGHDISHSFRRRAMRRSRAEWSGFFACASCWVDLLRGS